MLYLPVLWYNSLMDSNRIVSCVLSELDKHKVSDIKVYTKMPVAEFMVAVSSQSQKHTKALADSIIGILKNNNLRYYMEGYKEANWIVIDLFNVMIHIFRPEVREYYKVDELWS